MRKWKMRDLKYRWENILTMAHFKKERLIFLKFYNLIYFELKKKKGKKLELSIFYPVTQLKIFLWLFFVNHLTKRTVEDGI